MLVEKRPPFRRWHRCLRAGRPASEHRQLALRRSSEADESNQAGIDDLIDQVVEGGLVARLAEDDQGSPGLLAAAEEARTSRVGGEMRALESIGGDHGFGFLWSGHEDRLFAPCPHSGSCFQTRKIALVRDVAAGGVRACVVG